MTLNEKPDSSMKIVKTKTLPPAEGERRAMRGYMGQYERAGAAVIKIQLLDLRICPYSVPLLT